MISSLLHLVSLRPRVYYTLTNFRGEGGKAPLAPPPQYANEYTVESLDLDNMAIDVCLLSNIYLMSINKL